MNPTTTSAIFFLLCLYFGQGDAACADDQTRIDAVAACQVLKTCLNQDKNFLDTKLADIKDGGCAVCLAAQCAVTYVDGRCSLTKDIGDATAKEIFTKCEQGANSCTAGGVLTGKNKKCYDCIAFGCELLENIEDLSGCVTPCVAGFLDTTCKECVVKVATGTQLFPDCSTVEQPFCGVGSCTLGQVYKVAATLANNAQDACFGACFDLTKPSDDTACSDCITGTCTGSISSGTRMSKTSVLPLLFAVYWKWMA